MLPRGGGAHRRGARGEPLGKPGRVVYHTWLPLGGKRGGHSTPDGRGWMRSAAPSPVEGWMTGRDGHTQGKMGVMKKAGHVNVKHDSAELPRVFDAEEQDRETRRGGRVGVGRKLATASIL